jgi:mono/diheme cytochrome c family protein
MTGWKRTLWAIGAVSVLTATLLSVWPDRARARDRVRAQDIAAGRRLSETWCSACHLVGPDADLGVSTGAPAFAAIARQKSTTVSIRVFLLTPHAPNKRLSLDDIDNLAAYIVSLRNPEQQLLIEAALAAPENERCGVRGACRASP